MPKTFFADLHLHSKYSRAVSKDCDLKHLVFGAKQKGLNVLATSDFTHPLWFKELKENLVESDKQGLYNYRGDESVFFLFGCEVANFFSFEGKARKVHNLLFSPSIEEASQLNDLLSKKSNLSADGRPMLAKTTNAELVELVESVSKKNFVVPAHCMTPWFGVFGSKSGFNSLQEAFEDKTKSIFAVETGLSADPEMLSAISSLDRIAFISNSDAHSPYPWRLGRECNAFSFEEKDLSYDSLFQSIRKQDEHFAFTLEVDPAYGKYHFDGHRNCNFSCAPDETKELSGLCPVCGKPLVRGVLGRVEELADRHEGFIREKRVEFKKILPLHELVSTVLSVGLASKSVQSVADALLILGSELFVLLEASESQLSSKCNNEKLVAALLANRVGSLNVKPGFDGEYGKLVF